MHNQVNLHRILASLREHRATIKLTTHHLSYLVSLRLYIERENLASIPEDDLIELYIYILRLEEPDAPNPRKRASRVIQDLREYRLLRRVDTAEVMRAGEYTLTRLATAIADFFIQEEVLTKESLSVLNRTLISQLQSILRAAQKAENADMWQSAVIEPLRVVVGDLVSGIERRQAGLDARQEEIRLHIAGLLEKSWIEALEECENLLDEMASTLRELNQMLLRDTNQMNSILQDIEQRAEDANHLAAQVRAQKVQEHLTRVYVWGGERQKAWSEYYQYVHRFLRNVVRLDPDRAVSRRLRDQITFWTTQPFAFVRADESSIAVLREDIIRPTRPPLSRPPSVRERPLEVLMSPPASSDLEDRVIAAMEQGACTLAEVSELVLSDDPEAEHFRQAGRIAAMVSEHAVVSAPRERQWRPLASTLIEVEDWPFKDRGAS